MSVELKVRRLITGHYSVDDGSQLLDVCPCCGKTLTEAAAKQVVREINEGKMTFDSACRLAELARNAGS